MLGALLCAAARERADREAAVDVHPGGRVGCAKADMAQHALDRAGRDRLVADGDEQVRQRPPAGLRTRDEQHVGEGRVGEAAVGCQPCVDQPAGLERRLEPGALMLVELLGEVDELPQRRAGATLAPSARPRRRGGPLVARFAEGVDLGGRCRDRLLARAAPGLDVRPRPRERVARGVRGGGHGVAGRAAGGQQLVRGSEHRIVGDELVSAGSPVDRAPRRTPLVRSPARPRTRPDGPCTEPAARRPRARPRVPAPPRGGRCVPS